MDFQALCLALHNHFSEALRKDISKMRETIEVLCFLEPVNVDFAIEAVAVELESIIFDVIKQIHQSSAANPGK